jgi:DNA polymerase
MDFETRSEIDIRKVGGNKYTKHLDCLLCLSYQIDDEPVRTWRKGDPPPTVLFDAIAKGAELHAFNAPFEISVWRNHCVAKLGWPEVRNDRWVCTAAKARAAALPGSLLNAGKALGVQQLKSEIGKKVMMKLCKPRRPTQKNPSKWHESTEDLDILYAYCEDDVRAERAIDETVPDLGEFERDVWQLDLEINQRGVQVDTELARKAIRMWETYRQRLDGEVQVVTGGLVRNANQVAAMIRWLETRGIEAKSLNAESIDAYLGQDDLDADVRRLLQLRRELSRASVAKFSKMLECVEEDGRIRGLHMYFGAATGRWAGRLVQTQNLPRGILSSDEEISRNIDRVLGGDSDAIEQEHGSVGQVLASLVRPAIRAADGHRLIACDYAAVEARGIAWLAGEAELLAKFERGEDVYKAMASVIYSKPVDRVTKAERQLGKACILGAGYGMGKATFYRTCLAWGIQVSEELAADAIDAYRASNPAIARFWRDLNNAALRAVMTGQQQQVGFLKLKVHGDWLWCRLPSGRLIAYHQPSVRMRDLPSPPFPKGEQRNAVHFRGVDPVTGKARTESTYGGKLAENVTQGLCRDLLASAMIRLEKAGYPVVMHVHDEVVCEVPEGVGSVADVERIMSEVPEWAAGFPVAAEGFESERYKK